MIFLIDPSYEMLIVQFNSNRRESIIAQIYDVSKVEHFPDFCVCATAIFLSKTDS